MGDRSVGKARLFDCVIILQYFSRVYQENSRGGNSNLFQDLLLERVDSVGLVHLESIDSAAQ